MKAVVWSASAETDLAEIVAFISCDSQEKALAFGETIIKAVEDHLPHYPSLGRLGRVVGTREIVVHQNYVVIYRIKNSGVQVLAIAHAARLYP